MTRLKKKLIDFFFFFFYGLSALMVYLKQKHFGKKRDRYEQRIISLEREIYEQSLFTIVL